ncbi:MAG: hypothetical protein RLZZ437_368 [Pseudomonadota bacterium]|jgi:hypothetical protein
MKQSRSIEVIRPTLWRAARKSSLPMTNILTAGAALLAIVLSVSLSSAADPKACVMPLSGPAAPACE